MAAARKLATYDHRLALPEGVTAEIVAVSVVTLPSSRPRRSNVQRALGRSIGGLFHDDDGFSDPGSTHVRTTPDMPRPCESADRPIDRSASRRRRRPGEPGRPAAGRGSANALGAIK
jgi:hypothetical protein